MHPCLPTVENSLGAGVKSNLKNIDRRHTAEAAALASWTLALQSVSI